MSTDSAIELVSKDSNTSLQREKAETRTSTNAHQTSDILGMFHIGMSRIKIASVFTAVIHILVASTFIWIIGTKFSATLTCLTILGIVVAMVACGKVYWVIIGTRNGAEPNYTWLTKGFMWSVINLFSGNLAFCPLLVIIICHTKGTHFMDVMFKHEVPDNWREHNKLLFATIFIHGFSYLLALCFELISITHVSYSLLKNPGDDNQVVAENDDDDDEDDEDELGPVTTTHKKIACLSVVMDIILTIDFLMLAIVPNVAHSGLVIFVLLNVFLSVYRGIVVRKTFFQRKNLDEELLVNYRIFCVAHCILIYVAVWADLLVVVTIVHFKDTSLFRFIFTLPQPALTQVLFLMVLFIFGMANYTYLLFRYQKCMWLADKIASEKLADMLISAEEDDGDEGDDDDDEDHADEKQENR